MFSGTEGIPIRMSCRLMSVSSFVGSPILMVVLGAGAILDGLANGAIDHIEDDCVEHSLKV